MMQSIWSIESNYSDFFDSKYLLHPFAMVDEGFFGTIETQYPSLHWDLFVVSRKSESSL